MSTSPTSRRAMLQGTGLLLAGTVLPLGCAWSGAAQRETGPSEGVRDLQPVRVSEERLIRTVAGLRPFRPSGFVVRAEHIGEKTVVHNYGHGGCGVTLSWGTAHLAATHALATDHRRAAVLGCGAVGLATARLLQDRGFAVTLYAKDLPPHTTSNTASALWAPLTLGDLERRTAAFDDQLARAARFAHRYFQSLVGDRYGVRWIELYVLADEPPQALSWEMQVTADLFPSTLLQGREHPFGTRFARHLHMLLIEPATYLRAVLADFRAAGGKLVVQEFSDVQSVLQLAEPLVVNCTGLGAKALFGDDALVPIKGQLAVLVPQPEVDYAVAAATSGLYMFPRRDGVILGGTRERGVWSLEPDEAATRRILAGHQQLFAQMRAPRSKGNSA